MINNDIKEQALKLASSVSKEDLLWLSGYFYGLGDNNTSTAKTVVAKLEDISIVYITETGNCKFLANEISKYLKSLKIKVKLKSSTEYRLTDINKEKNLIIITSTHGDGEIPKAGEKLFAHLKDTKDLTDLNYLVIALGDSAYPLFCKAGIDIDELLKSKKANQLTKAIEFDLDFEEHMQTLCPSIKDLFTNSQATPTTTTNAKSTASNGVYKGTIATNINLNDTSSSKVTHHIEIEAQDELIYEPGDCIAILPKNEKTPRLYSISSSLNEHGNEVHITVSVVQYKDKKGKTIKGVASNYLADLKSGDNIEFTIKKNRIFKLPSDDKDIIMIGPGTGIAPFRAFMAERNYRGCSGKSWLFFGERNFVSDFLYQSEWLDYLDSKTLTNLSVAFSRDTDKKVYVQHKIEEQGKEIFDWIENGAYIYICGDKTNMAKDVEQSLLKVIKKYSSKKSDKYAKEYLQNLSAQDRYLLDVY